MALTRSICFLIFPGFQPLDLTGPLAVFCGADKTADRSVYDVRVASAEGGAVRSLTGVDIVSTERFKDTKARASTIDTLIVVGGEAPDIDAAIQHGEIVDTIQACDGQVRRLASVCSGAFFLAEAGCLDGHRATTHWAASTRLAERYREVTVDDDAIFVQSRNIWTSAGVTAGIDLALALVEQDLDRQTALTIARHLVVPRIRSGGQSQFSCELNGRRTSERRLNTVLEAIREVPDGPWNIERMAQHARISRRTLTRLCRAEFDTTPAALVETIRLDAARRDLVETDLPIDDVAWRSGLKTAHQMDRVFKRRLGVTPSAFRSRFRSPFRKEDDA